MSWRAITSRLHYFVPLPPENHYAAQSLCQRAAITKLDADEFGARLAAAAGYDPRGAIRAFERLQGLEADGATPLSKYFSSHPPLAVRIERLRALMNSKRR